MNQTPDRLAGLPMAIILAAGILVAVAFGLLLAGGDDDPEAELRPAQTPFRATASYTTTPGPSPHPLSIAKPIPAAKSSAITSPLIQPRFSLPNSDGIRLLGGVYMVSPDGTSLAEAAVPEDAAAGSHFGFSAHSMSPDGRWLAYAPRQAFNNPGQPSEVGLFVKDLSGSEPTAQIAAFSRIWSLALSPGGNQVLVNGSLDPSAQPSLVTGEYFLVDVQTGAVRQLLPRDSGHGANWSPSGDRVLVVSSGEAGGSTLTFYSTDGAVILTLNTPSGHLAWSPDGSRLALGAYTGGKSGIYVIEMDGTIHYVSDASPYQWSGMSWSPDSNRISLTYLDQQPMIAILDVTTSALTPLVPGEQPAWSRDGRRIAFIDDGTLAVADAQTGITSRLVVPAQPLVSSPQWLSGDSGLAFHYTPWFLRSITTASGDGTDERHIAYGHSPAWSPDGSRIAFVGRVLSAGLAGLSEVWVMNNDGSDARKVGEYGSTDISSGCGLGPAWSANGSSVLYFNPVAGATISVRADGTGRHTEDARACDASIRSQPTYPQLSPDGTRSLNVR